MCRMTNTIKVLMGFYIVFMSFHVTTLHAASSSANNTNLYCSQENTPPDRTLQSYSTADSELASLHSITRSSLIKEFKISEGKQDEIKKKLEILETSWRGLMRWSTADSLLQKIFYVLLIRAQNSESQHTEDENHAVPGDQPDQSDSQSWKSCFSPIFLYGGSFPLTSANNRRVVHFIDGLRQGLEFAIFSVR